MQPIVDEVLYYIYVLLFGVYVSIRIACGAVGAREWRLFAAICPVLLIIQGICLQLWGINVVWMLYPLIAHAPIVLAVILFLKVRWDRALVAVIISYSLCQLLRWIGLMIEAFAFKPMVSLIIHLSLCQLLLMLLDKYCLRAIHDVVHHSPYLLRWFGALPIIYYVYEYFTIYTQARYAHLMAFNELLPTGMVLFFILFAVAYQREMEKREQAEHQAVVLETELSHAEREIVSLRATEEQTALYRHDLHHHLMMIDGLLATNKAEQAAAYIHEVVHEIEAIAPVRYCENETINLLLSAFKGKMEGKGITLNVKTSLPRTLNVPETELCAILSNGLENALNAVACLPKDNDKVIDVFCGVKQNNLLVEIRNPYDGVITMKDGIPVAPNDESHYGCRSIQSIVQRRKGVCAFDATKGVFVLRVAIPMETDHGKSAEA